MNIGGDSFFGIKLIENPYFPNNCMLIQSGDKYYLWRDGEAFDITDAFKHELPKFIDRILEMAR